MQRESRIRHKPRAPGDDQWERRQALQLAAQLPDGQASQLRILGHLSELVRGFLAPARRKARKA